jgi:hypothetical protein
MPSLFGAYDPTVEFGLIDDFLEISTWWNAVNDGTTGTNTLDATHGGTYTIKTAAADNDYHFIVGDAKYFTLTAGKSLTFETRLRLTEAATNAANIIAGFSSDIAATALGDNGAGPPASYSGVVFFKVDGGTVWQAESSVGSVQTTTTSAAAFTSGGLTDLKIVVDPGDATTSFVTFFVNGARVAQHRMAIASQAAMAPIVGVKAGSASAENLIVDFVAFRATK